MGKSDIEFTIGLNTSPAEQSLNNLFNDTNVYKGRLQKALNSGISQQVYESKLRKMSNLVDRVGSDPRKMSTQDHNRFINLRNDIGRYERIIHNFSNTATKVLSQVNNYSGEKKLDPFVKGIATTERLRNYYSGGGDLQTKYEKAFAMGAYEQYKKLTTPSNILALPAPKSAEENVLDNKTVTSRMNDDLKKIREKKKASIKEQKESVKEEKALNREHDAGIIKLFKITSILYGIKKLIQGLGKLRKFEVTQNIETTARDIKEKGFFSVDAYGAMHANTNKERASIARGLEFYGGAAPFSIGDFDSAVKALQELRNKAVSGQGIADDQRVISLDRITRLLGLDWNIGQMLTNPNLDLTEMISTLMDKVEKFLPNLDKLKNIDKALFINDAITSLGGKLMDAISYHANLNARTGGTGTLIEETKEVGQSVYLPIDYTKSAKEFAEAFAKEVSTSKTLKNAFAQWIEKPALGLLGLKKSVEARTTQWFNLQNLIKGGFIGPGTLLVASDYKYLKQDKTEEKLNKRWAEANIAEILAAKEYFAKHPEEATDEDVLRYLNFGTPALESGVFGHGVEATGLLGLASKYANSGAPSFDAMINNPNKFGLSQQDVNIIKMIKAKYPSLNKLGDYKDWQEALGRMKEEIWGEGAVGDFSPEQGEKISDYLRNLWGEDYYNRFMHMLYTAPNSPLFASGMYTGSNEMNVDGKIVIELKRSDLTGSVEVHSLPATITVNGTKQAIEMAVTD